jgi:hypothetical protein
MKTKLSMGKVNTSGPSSKTEDDYRAESDHSTLQRAEEVRQDPGRMRGVARHHAKKMDQMQAVGAELGFAGKKRKAAKRAPSRGRRR